MRDCGGVGVFTGEAPGNKSEKLPCAMSRPVLSNM